MKLLEHLKLVLLKLQIKNLRMRLKISIMLKNYFGNQTERIGLLMKSRQWNLKQLIWSQEQELQIQTSWLNRNKVPIKNKAHKVEMQLKKDRLQKLAGIKSEEEDNNLDWNFTIRKIGTFTNEDTTN